MSVPPSASVNVYQEVASALAEPTPSVEVERFKEAVDQTRRKKKYERLDRAFVNKFAAAETAEEFLQVFESCRDQNRLFRTNGPNKTSSNVTRAADRVSALGAFRDLVTIPDFMVAAPIQGVLWAALTVVRNVLQAQTKLSLIDERIQRCTTLYSTLYEEGRSFDKQVQTALHQFNLVVVEFSFDIGLLLSGTQKKFWLNAASRNLPDELELISLRLQNATSAVTEAVIFETNRNVGYARNKNTFVPVPHTANNQNDSANGDGRARVHRLPGLLSRHFIGRKVELSTIARIFSGLPETEAKRCVLIGMPGVGKSQLALRFAHDNLVGRYKYILFIRATSEAETIGQLKWLAASIGIQDDPWAENKAMSAIEQLKEWLLTHHDWLFVVDNIADSNHILNFLPVCCHGHMLFTTRDPNVAHSLVDSSNTIEVDLFSDTEGKDLVLQLASVADPTEAQAAKAFDIFKFAMGLPLAIEQIVKFGIYTHNSWEKGLEQIKTKASILKQRMINSNHEHNLSVGAIVSTTLDSIRASHTKAAAFFELLCYFSTSNISRHIFRHAKVRLNRHFERSHTYNLGRTRDRTQTERFVLQDWQENGPFRFLDFDPLSPAFFQRISRQGIWGRAMRLSKHQKVDSSQDTALRRSWISDKDLEAVLEDDTVIDNALTHLVSTGLIRRDHRQGTIWIHDLFAQVTQEINETDSKDAHLNRAHLAATMVYLAFPVAQTFTLPLCELLLPHAIVTITCLRSEHILNDCTIGAELCHLVASFLQFTASWREGGERTSYEGPIKYYQYALAGYIAAWRRLMSVPAMSWEKVLLSTYADYTREALLTGYTGIDHNHRSERVGKSAPWRCIQTMLRLGVVLTKDDRLDDALATVDIAVRLTEKMFGSNEQETFNALDILRSLYVKRGEYEQAYAVSRKRAAVFMGFEVTNHLDTSNVSDKELQYRALNPLLKPRASTEHFRSFCSYLSPLKLNLLFRPRPQITEEQRLLKIVEKASKSRHSKQESQNKPFMLGVMDATDYPQQGLLDPGTGGALAAELGDATSKIPGMEWESWFWWSLAYKARLKAFCEGTRETVPVMIQCSRALLKLAKCLSTGGKLPEWELKPTQVFNPIEEADDKFYRSLLLAKWCVQIALRGDDARNGPHPKGLIKPEPTVRQQILAGDEPDWAFKPADKDGYRKMKGWVGPMFMRDTYAEEVIPECRGIIAEIPKHVYKDGTQKQLDDLEYKIKIWDTEQYFWRAENFAEFENWWDSEDEDEAEVEPEAVTEVDADLNPPATVAVELTHETADEIVVEPMIETRAGEVEAKAEAGPAMKSTVVVTNKTAAKPMFGPVTAPVQLPKAAQIVVDASISELTVLEEMSEKSRLKLEVDDNIAQPVTTISKSQEAKMAKEIEAFGANANSILLDS